MKIDFTKNLADHSKVDVEIHTPNGSVSHSEIQFASADEALLFIREMESWSSNKCAALWRNCECSE